MNEIHLSSLKQRLRHAIERAGITQREIAKRRKVTEQAVSKWLTTGRIPYEHQEAVADLLGVSIGWLNFGEAPRGDQATVIEVPIITWESIGSSNPVRLGKTWTFDTSDKAFALRVEGDAMAPRYPEGALIVVDPAAQPINGCRVVVLLDNGSPAFRSYVQDAGQVYLRPLNPDYATIPGAGARVIGRVVQTIIPER